MFFSCCSMDTCRQKEDVAIASAKAPSSADAGSPGSIANPRAAAQQQESSAKGPTSDVATAASCGNALASALSSASGGRTTIGQPAPLSLLVKSRSADKLDSIDAASVASSQKHSVRSAISTASSIGSEFINDRIPAHQREVARIQSQMKSFVKGMVKGRDMSVLSVDGQLRSCTCSFDRKLRNYNILISKETRSIPLSRFSEVFQGTEPEDIATPLDELCCTFVLDNGECLTFRFKDVQERENFAMCLQIIVDGHQ